MSTSQDKSDQNSRGSDRYSSQSSVDDEKKRLRNEDLDPLDKISAEMRRYVEDKDFLDSYVRRENRSMENEGKGKPRATGSFKQPEDTIPYTVKRGETLSGIAVCNNMSTFHLKTLNRLGSGMLFPGQVLYIPARQESRTYVTCCSSKESAPSSSKMSDGDSTVDESVAPIVECQENVFSSNAEAEKRKSEHTDNTPAVNSREEEEEEVCEGFVKIKAKYITDCKGTVSGMLLVTPQCLMFYPSILDPLIIDNGIESYSLILQMESVSSCAVYDDFIKMQQKDRPAEVQAPDGHQSNDHFLLCSRSIDLPHLSSICSTEHRTHNEAVNSLGTTQKLSEENQETHELYSISGSPIDNGITALMSVGGKEDNCTEETEFVQNDETNDSHQVEVFEWNPDDLPQNSKNCEESSSGLVDIKGQENDVENKDEEVNSGKKTNPALEFQRMSDATEVPVVSISPVKPTKKSEPVTIPRPSCHLGVVNRFFCVQLSSPVGDNSLTKSAVYIPASYASQSIGKELLKCEGMKPEYWFAIALERVDQLYAFLVQWCPSLQETSYEQMKEIEKDFVMISLSNIPDSQQMGFCDGHYASDPNITLSPRSSLGVEANPIPLLIGETVMLTNQRLLQLTVSLPRRLIGYDWKLIYSTFCHGISLKTLYRNMLHVTGPVIVLVQAKEEEVV